MQPQSEFAAYLEWFRAMGVTDFSGDEPLDWFGLSAAPPPAAQVDRTMPGVVSSKAPARAALSTAIATKPAAVAIRVEANSAPTLEALRAALETFDGCGLKATAKNLCFYRGAAVARVMCIGDAPGADEDRAGVPFVGTAGKLLDKMLAAIGLDETHVHITNSVYWRPPGNRTPTPIETEACAPFLLRQIELVAPEMIVLLGGSAAKQMLGVDEGIMKLRGKWRTIETGGRTIPVLATLHPTFLLQTPAQKRLAWKDLLMLDAALRGVG